MPVQGANTIASLPLNAEMMCVSLHHTPCTEDHGKSESSGSTHYCIETHILSRLSIKAPTQPLHFVTTIMDSFIQRHLIIKLFLRYEFSERAGIFIRLYCVETDLQ